MTAARSYRLALLLATLWPLPALADGKKECGDAYDATQTLRDKADLIGARREAVTCAAATCSAAYSKECTAWLAEIDRAMPTVVLSAKLGDRDATGVRVLLDGALLSGALDGKAIALNPGAHALRFEVAGADAIEENVMIREGEKDRAIVATFAKPFAPQATSDASSTPASTQSHATPRDTKVTEHRLALWPVAPLVLGTAFWGLAGGSVVVAVRKKNALDGDCAGNIDMCPVSMKTIATSDSNAHNAFTALAIASSLAGAVGIGVGIGGFASQKNAQSTNAIAPIAAPGMAGAAWRGVF